MKDKLKNLSRKKKIISAILIILLVFMVVLVSVLKPIVKDIKISKVITNTKTLSASIIDGVSEGVTSNNYDEIKYQIKVEKENNSDEAIIIGTLSDEESKYARFKGTKEGIVTNNGKEITVTTLRKNITITVIVENAPYGVNINPDFSINSLDSNNSKINVDPVTITGKSVEGTVIDDNGITYSGIELGLYSNGNHIKSTYSKEDGKYVFSLGDLDNYEIRLEESKYSLVRFIDETTDTNRKVLNVSIKEVTPFTLDIRKAIYKLDLIVNGKKEEFSFDDEYKVVKSLKNAKTIEGSIYYNIYLKNEGEVKGTLTVLKDALPEGLSFDESKNPGWVKEGKYLFYTVLEGKELEAFEKTSATLVLDIVKTEEAKTYLNSAYASGDDYKYVAYYLNGSIFKEEYVVNSEKIDNINPNVENFDGWYTDREYTNKYDFNKEITKDIILYGKISNNKYNVTFIDINPNNDSQTILDIKEVNEGDPVDLIEHPEYNGYTFTCFKLNDTCYQDEEILADIELYTSYSINNYEIEYDLDEGILSAPNPTIYTVNDEITLNNPSKEGYTFLGWTGTDLSEITENVTIPVGSTGKRSYVANFQINRSTLTIDPNGGTYEDNASLVTFTEDYGTIKIVSESVRRGYNFLRYDKVGGGSYQDLSYLFDNDDATLTAIYEIIPYEITYSNITDEERTFLNNRTEYNVETETFTLKNPNTRVDTQGNNYQDFLGWDDGNGNVSLTVTIPKGSIGNKSYTAVWKENEDDYGITYELHGGSYEEGKSNPSTYTRQTNTFTLNNPSKEGYTFTGWTGTGLSSATETVTIPKGSAGDRTYTANYEVIPYEIHYHGLTSSEENALNNPTGYNIESASITLSNPTRTGYEFIGWSGTGITDKSTSVIIPTGSTGNRDYTANFREIEYSLTYTLDGGEYEQGKTNPDKYSIESDPITLNNPSKNGYTFKGWSGTDLTGNENTTVTIPTGSIGHRSFLANYTPIVYFITYDYDGGNLPTGVTNPDRYTIESEEITFNSPEKEGYTFTHYTSGNNIITSIPTGSTGDVSLKANYEINKFTVSYYSEGVLYSKTENINWNTSTSKPSVDPTSSHKIFLFWSTRSDSDDRQYEYDFSTLITENKNLYAVYEEVLAPTISYTPTLDSLTNRTWVCNDPTNDNCGDTVTISYNELLTDTTGYELFYKIGDGEVVKYTEPFPVYENTTITAFAKKSNIYSVDTTEDIINVDAVAPTINNPGTGATSFNISLSGTALDAGSGVKQFTLYAKEKDALTYDDRLTYTSEILDGIKDHAENYDHIFYGIVNDEYIIHDDTEYIIKIVAEDYVGNISEKEVEVKTHPYVARVVGKNGILWYTVDPDTKEFVLNDGKEFLLFDSIQSAVDYCAEIECTIQTNPIFPVVNESVTVGSNQNVTIDLDGRTITSDQAATFVNNGELHIVDRNPRVDGIGNHESIGKVTNTTNKTIINNGKFVLGEGSSEPSETFVFPEMDRPIIEGVENALEQNNLFYFYDGKLISNGTVILDHGEDAITQYSYNAILSGEDDKNIAILDKVTDPEARIKSTYYAKLKVNNNLNAFDASKNGTISTEEAKWLSKIKQSGGYGFIYDAVNDEIYNGNNSTANTTAQSYIKIDLTEETEGKYIAFDMYADTYSTNSYGYVSVSEIFGETGTQIHRFSGNKVSTSRAYYLEKGKVYYIYFGFVKGGGDVNPDETFKITSFSLLGEREETSDFRTYNDANYYGFSKQDDGRYVCNNKGINTTTAHAYSIFDLREETEDLYLRVNVDTSIGNSGSHAWVWVSDNTSYQGADTTTGRYFYINSSSANRTIGIPLEAGKVYYVHYAFYNYYDSNGAFYINGIAFTRSKGEDHLPEMEITHNSGDSNYFNNINYYSWSDLTGNSKDITVFGATLNEEQNGFVFDGNDYAMAVGGITSSTLTSETVELEYSTSRTSNQVYYIGSGNQNIGIGTWDGYLIVSNKNNATTYAIPENLADGEKHKITVTYDEGTYSAYFDNEPMVVNSNTNSFSGASSNLNIGRRDTYDNYFVGTIYGLKVYNRALSSEEISNPSEEGLILNLNGANSTKTSKSGYLNTNIGGYYDTAHSYIVYDLTDIDEDKYLYINTAMSRTNGSGYVAVTDSASTPSGTNGRAIDLASTVDNQAGVLKLIKNSVNYVHFYYTNNWNDRNRYKDFFLIKELRYCNTLEDAYSINPTNYSKVNTNYFEKPILNEKVDTIELLKDIALNTVITVPSEKEVILDLNGHILTSEKDDYIIKNNGVLEITDSVITDKQKQNVDYKTEQSRLFEDAKARYFEDLAEYQEYAGLCDGCEPSDEYKYDHLGEYLDYFGIEIQSSDLDNAIYPNVENFDYTGNEQTFTVPSTGFYKLEVWGAQGGDAVSKEGGYGGYSNGLIALNEGNILYINVGEQGKTHSGSVGYITYNGGGAAGKNSGSSHIGDGGGATHIAYVSGQLKSLSNNKGELSQDGNYYISNDIIIVAGGGGGADHWGNYYAKGGNAGGYKGVTGEAQNWIPGQGGTQIFAGQDRKPGSFGLGGSGQNSSPGGGAGGGGFFGGAAAYDNAGGGGGSGYIANPYLMYKQMTCYDCEESDDLNTKTISVNDVSEDPISNYAKKGSGYVRISYPAISQSKVDEIRESITTTYTIKEEPVFKDYLTGIDFDSSVDINTITPESSPTYNDTVVVTSTGSITTTINHAILNEQYASLTVNYASINVNVNSKYGIVNRGKLVVKNDANINANNSSTIAIYNETLGEVSGNGALNAKGSSSVGLLNRSNTSLINDLNVYTTPSNAIGIRNESIADVTYTNINVTGAGLGFREYGVANTTIVNSNIKSTGNNAVNSIATSLPVKLDITSSNISGTLNTDYSTRIVNVNNSSLTSVSNYLGYIVINNSDVRSISNSGKVIVNDSNIYGTGTLITNSSSGTGTGRSGTQTNSNLVLKNSVINSTATSATTVVNNTNDMLIDNIEFNNVNNAASTAINNSAGSDNGAYLTIVGNTSIAPNFGTAINNSGTLTLGTNEESVGTTYEYGYTGHQEEFIAPEDGLYKLETWGASGGRIRNYSYDSFWLRGGFGAYASGTIYLNAGDKLYIHVGQSGTYGDQLYGTYNGGGRAGAGGSNHGAGSSGGGATDISLSNEDNTWIYTNGETISKRSNSSYEQRIIVAGGGGVCRQSSSYSDVRNLNYENCSGGYPATTRLGYANVSGGGGYYGGGETTGGSSYVSDSLTNTVMLTGNQEMPDYTSSGLIKGNIGNGYAKITIVTTDGENVTNKPTISAINYGITGSGKVIYHDGAITAKTAVNSDIYSVPDGYDIYNSLDSTSNERMILLPNSNSKPVEEGEEKFVAAIGNAKYTTIQNALDASNNGDEIDILVNIEQQNMVTIPADKIITIDYNGHTVKSYNNNYLFENLGNLTIINSENVLNKNVFLGDKYIYNEGTLNVSNIYISNSGYSVNLIQNNEGTVTLDGVKLDFGSSISSRTALSNSANGTLTIKNSTINLYNNNNMINNLGSLIFKDNTVTGSSNASVVVNEESGTAILDGNTYSVSGNDNSGRYFINNIGTATIKNMNSAIEDFYNTGVLTLENNNITSGTITSSSLLIINSGTYNASINISGSGISIDDTDNLYSFIMHDGTINKTLNRSATGITNIEGGTISVTTGYAVNNTTTGTINLGIHDNSATDKTTTKPMINGKTYGIYTSNPNLIVNFYDGIVIGQKSYNVTIENIETGYTLCREYDEENDIETKYLTDEPMFKNVTQDIDYRTVDDLNAAISNGLVNNGDTISVYRNITITKNDNPISIPSGLSITFDNNGKITDKNNELMINNNGELTIIDSDVNSRSKIDSTIGDLIMNNGILNITGGNYISEKYTTEVELIKNNENATLNISGGTFTKYYDSLGYRQRNSGAIIVNDGEVNVTGGKFYANGSYVLFYYRRIGGNGQVGTSGTGDSNYFFTSAVFVNNATGTLTVTGGEYDGITSASYEDNYGWQSYATTNTGELIYNYGIATFDGITSNNSHIGRNDGTMSMDNVTMEKIVNINHQRYTWNSNRGSHQNFINTGNLTIDNSSFKLYTTLVDNRGNLDITNTTVDRLGNGTAFSNEGDSTWLGPQSSYLIRTIYNANRDNYTNITNCNLYNKGSGEAVYNYGLTNIVNTTIETSGGAGIVSNSGTLNVSDQTSVTSNGSSGISISNSILNLGKPIDVDSALSKTYPMIKGNTYGITNSNGTFNFYDGILMGKTNRVNGVISTIEDGYIVVEDVDGDYKTNYLDRVPIIQNITQATPSDEKKYFELDTAFSEAQDGDTLQMISNYSTLPTALTAVNNANITFDLNGKFIKQTNDLLFTNNSTLNIIDSSENKTGQLIAFAGSKVIDNYGTINYSGGEIVTSVFRLLIKNNTGALLNIKEDAKINASNIATLIDNDGTVNITNGAYLHNHAGTPSSFRGTNDGLPMIINRNELNIIDLNNDDDDLTSSTYASPKLNSEGVPLAGFAYWFETGYYDSIVRNETNANLTIYGGTFNNGSTTSPNYGKILHNFGTVVIKNLNSYAYVIGYNNGSLTIENSIFNNFCAGGLVSTTGSLVIRNTSINFYQPEFTSGFVANNDAMHIANITFDHVTFTGGQHTNNGEDPLRLINIVGPGEIIDSSINLIAETRVLYNGSTLTITNTPITLDKAFVNDGTLTLNNSNVTVTNNTGISNNGTINFINSDVTVTNGTAISNSGRINFNTNMTVFTTNGNGIYNTGQFDISSGVTIISQSGYGIYLDGDGKINVGEIGGVPDQNDPHIEGSTYGIYRAPTSSPSSFLNFYDGVIIGATGPNAVYGEITDVESGYETKNATDPNDNKYHEYLIVSATSVAIAKVGNYTFSANSSISPSKALQNAINFAIGDGTNVRSVNLVTNVNLVNDEYSIVASIPITINTNGNTITEDNTYYLDSNITLNNGSLGGNLGKLLASITSPITRDIIIYEMSDGTSLDITKTYKLYKDNKLVKLSKEELGKYSLKGDNENLVPIKGRIYINELTSGSYKLVSSDNKTIEFTITDEGHIRGNVSEYISKNYGSTSKASAELILTIQTGIKKHYYYLAIIPVFLLIISLIIITRKKRLNS